MEGRRGNVEALHEDWGGAEGGKRLEMDDDAAAEATGPGGQLGWGNEGVKHQRRLPGLYVGPRREWGKHAYVLPTEEKDVSGADDNLSPYEDIKLALVGVRNPLRSEN